MIVAFLLKPDETPSPARVSWEGGLIAKGEEFLHSRLPIGEYAARAAMTALVSIGLRNAVLIDKKGPVYATNWFVVIGESALACKTPLLKMIKTIMLDYDRSLIPPPTFTVAGLVMHIGGCEGDAKARRKEIRPHPAGIFLIDEASKMFGSNPYSVNANLGFINELIDNHIDGRISREFQAEGNLWAYYSMFGVSTSDFLGLMPDNYMSIGTGVRKFWVNEDMPAPRKEDAKSFFMDGAGVDEDFANFAAECIRHLRRLEAVKVVELTDEAKEFWVEYDFSNQMVARELSKTKMSVNEGSYRTKMNLGILKLAMTYAASRHNILERLVLLVTKEDLERAANDIIAYILMWKRVTRIWEDMKNKPRQNRVELSTVEVREYVCIAIRNGGLCSVASIITCTGATNRNSVGLVLETARDMGYMELAADQNSLGSLTPEELARFKPERGPTPRIYRVTEKGRAECT